MANEGFIRLLLELVTLHNYNKKIVSVCFLTLEKLIFNGKILKVCSCVIF